MDWEKILTSRYNNGDLMEAIISGIDEIDTDRGSVQYLLLDHVKINDVPLDNKTYGLYVSTPLGDYITRKYPDWHDMLGKAIRFEKMEHTNVWERGNMKRVSMFIPYDPINWK